MIAILVLACDPGPAAPTWYQDAQPIVQRDCGGCHDETGGSSGIPLTSYAAASVVRERLGAAVEDRRMPPWLADDACASYEDDFSLSGEDRQTLLDWVAAGGPEGDPAASAAPVPAREARALDRVDLELAMPTAYLPTSTPDDYRCFILPWPEADTVWVTGFDIVPGDAHLAHHAIAYLISPTDADAYHALDAADPAEGYTCFGGPGGDIDTLIRTAWLGGWAHGTGATKMPAGTGLEVRAGSLVILQMHYNTASYAPVPDQSRLALTVEHERQAWASLEAWTDVSWILGAGMDIPAMTDGVAHEFAYTLDGDSSFTLHGAALHAHKLARSAKLEIAHADGTTSCVLDIPRYDFDWQREYHLSEPITARPGDTLRLSCVWDNPTDQDVAWGEGTGDEMCVGITLITE